MCYAWVRHVNLRRLTWLPHNLLRFHRTGARARLRGGAPGRVLPVSQPRGQARQGPGPDLRHLLSTFRGRRGPGLVQTPAKRASEAAPRPPPSPPPARGLPLPLTGPRRPLPQRRQGGRLAPNAEGWPPRGRLSGAGSPDGDSSTPPPARFPPREDGTTSGGAGSSAWAPPPQPARSGRSAGLLAASARRRGAVRRSPRGKSGRAQWFGAVRSTSRPPRCGNVGSLRFKDTVETQMRAFRTLAWSGLPAAFVCLPDGRQQLHFSSSDRGYSGQQRDLTRRLCLRKKT